jgi:hypothetical protein
MNLTSDVPIKELVMMIKDTWLVRLGLSLSWPTINFTCNTTCDTCESILVKLN